jgi:hypothetical protein
MMLKNIYDNWKFTYSRDNQIPISTLAAHTLANPAIAGFSVPGTTLGHSMVISSIDIANSKVTLMDPFSGTMQHWTYSYLQGPTIYGNWILTDLITGHSAGPLQAFHCSNCGSWGEIKDAYRACSYTEAASSEMASFEAGALEPRSSKFNRIAWKDFAGETGQYNILRSVDDAGDWSTLKIKGAGDTVLIDSTSIPGHMYHYGVMSLNGDTLKYTDEMSFGLQAVSQLCFYDINSLVQTIVNGDTTYGAPRRALMIPDGQFLYIASALKVKKIDVSDPHNPMEVGSRDLSFLPEYDGHAQDLMDMQIGYYNSYLFVLTSHCLVVIDKTNNALPVISTYNSFSPTLVGGKALAVNGNIAYVAGYGGIYALSFRYPTNLELWGHYSGFGASAASYPLAIESVGDYLYVEFPGSVYRSYTEILKPRVYEQQQAVHFDLVCSNHDSLVCFPACTDLIAPSGDSYYTMEGNPMGYYVLGKTDDTTFAVYDVSNPTNPRAIQTIKARWDRINKGGIIEFFNNSYAFDDQYLYVGMSRYTGNPWSSVYVFDLYSGSSDPIYALGDMVIGQDKTASVASWGKYLYYFDRPRDDRAYHRLQIFEKARACDPNLSVAFGPDQIASAYEIESNARISWHCVGCPIRVDVVLVEDGATSQTLASLRKFDQPNLAANSITWPVQGISPHPENHSYALKILAWNIEGKYAECTSRSFSIVEHIQIGGKGPIPIVDVSLENGKSKSYPLPGFAIQSSEEASASYWIFPESPEITDGEFSITLTGCQGKQLSVTAMDLMTVDAPNDYDVTLAQSGPMLVAAGKEPAPVVPSSSMAAGAQELAGVQGAAIHESQAMQADEQIRIAGGERYEFKFAVADKSSDLARHYILRFRGLLLASGEEELRTPRVFALKNPYPNPFNPSTIIEFDVPKSARIELAIYNVAGTLITRLRDGSFKPGVYRVTWDGRDSGGGTVASGVYFCKLTIDGRRTMTRKLVMLR